MKHYEDFKPIIDEKLDEFRRVHNEGSDVWFEEMAFCIFAANSSADMGLLAVDLLRPVLKDGSLEDYKEAVRGKVRFYNVRSEFLYYNKNLLAEKGVSLKELIKSQSNFYDRRRFIKDNFKGFGFKEASHFLRNVGYKGYAIVDKHVLKVLKGLEVLDSDRPPKIEEEYYGVESKIHWFAKSRGLSVDALDLALWSYKTGKIVK